MWNVLFGNELFLVTAKLSTASESKVASFPPKDNLTPPLISSSEIASARATPNNDDTSSMIDGDMICSDEDVLGAYDDKKAEEHGEEIILLRKRVRQVNIFIEIYIFLENYFHHLVTIEMFIRFMVE